MNWQPLPFESSGPDGLYRIENDRCYLWLYGTNHEREWPFHFSGCRVKTAIGWANINYYREAMLVYAWILDNIDVRNIQIGGHSYGGALAQIVAAMCEYNRNFNVDCITFGTVRAGRLEMPESSENWIHRGDVVPWWPLWPLYSLKGKRIVFGEIGLTWVVHQPGYYVEAIASCFKRGLY
jgi:pimeloyl-ACP methyl ester carboxylesterase